MICFLCPMNYVIIPAVKLSRFINLHLFCRNNVFLDFLQRYVINSLLYIQNTSKKKARKTTRQEEAQLHATPKSVLTGKYPYLWRKIA
ncbi:unnamed protein product [Acanthoscelides obtectus]|uniref:Uncharacterized protein n=1 Tax=Acanthoscelides obtectus TaxID=200917 RepID=A0A9P0M342_ACAOB|nr:unnamed protein product [Acanthoscelides obtectus]CAK1647780.1 hypothetical protein AOBTE_LOCUS15393 [Acanthoscelides obtectus]